MFAKARKECVGAFSMDWKRGNNLSCTGSVTVLGLVKGREMTAGSGVLVGACGLEDVC